MSLVDFIGGLRITQGRLAGEPITLLPWQCKFLRRAFADGVSRAALSIPRGAGKSTLLGGVCLAFVDGPLMLPRAECLLVAPSYRQARISFEHALAFLRERYAPDEIKKRFRILDSTQYALIENRETQARLRAIGSTPGLMHGAAPSLVLLDELAQYPGSQIEAALAALNTALGKMPGSRLVAISTRAADPNHPFEQMLAGDSDYAQCHAADKDAPIFQERTWRKANPSLEIMPDLLDMYRAEAKAAKRDERALASFKALRLNMGVSDTADAVLISAEIWTGEVETDDLPPRKGPCIWGVDLGGGTASSAVAAYWPQTGRLEGLAAFGDDPAIDRRAELDGVGQTYARALEDGSLILLPGRVPDIEALMNAAFARYGQPSAIVADRYKSNELIDGLSASNLSPTPLVFRGMGWIDGSSDIRDFTRAVMKGQVRTPEKAMMRSAIGEARLLGNPAGDWKLAKNQQGGRRKRARDDLAAAAILAIAEGWRKRRTIASPRSLSYGLVG